jgi:hypothetical protein
MQLTPQTPKQQGKFLEYLNNAATKVYAVCKKVSILAASCFCYAVHLVAL